MSVVETSNVIAVFKQGEVRALFFFNDTATTGIYTLSLHDALPISPFCQPEGREVTETAPTPGSLRSCPPADRKSTRLNSSHLGISYAVFCLKKKKKNNTTTHKDNQIKTILNI